MTWQRGEGERLILEWISTNLAWLTSCFECPLVLLHLASVLIVQFFAPLSKQPLRCKVALGSNENFPNSLDLTSRASSLLLYVCMAMPCVFSLKRKTTGLAHFGARCADPKALPCAGFVAENLGTLFFRIIHGWIHDFPWFSMIFQWWIIHWWIMFPWCSHCFPIVFPWIVPSSLCKLPLTKPWGTSRPGLQRDLHWTMVGLGYVTTVC